MFKKVTEEEYNVLSRYHPTEIRYYVDMSKVLKGKRKAKSNGNGHHVEAARPRASKGGGLVQNTGSRNWRGKNGKDRLLALSSKFGNTRKSSAIGTISEKIERSIGEIYNRNLFTQYRRSTLIQKLKEETKLNDGQISPVISKLIASQKLRTVPDDAKIALDISRAKSVAALVS